jgi:flagellin-like protein
MLSVIAIRMGRSRNDQPGRIVPSMLCYKRLRIANHRNFHQKGRQEYGHAIVVHQTLLVLAALVGVADELVTGNDRALSGIIAALLAVAAAVTAFEGLIGSRERRQLCNVAELHLEEEKSAGTPPARCRNGGRTRAGRVDPLDQNGHWANWSSKAPPKGGLHRTGRS